MSPVEGAIWIAFEVFAIVDLCLLVERRLRALARAVVDDEVCRAVDEFALEPRAATAAPARPEVLAGGTAPANTSFAAVESAAVGVPDAERLSSRTIGKPRPPAGPMVRPQAPVGAGVAPVRVYRPQSDCVRGRHAR